MNLWQKLWIFLVLAGGAGCTYQRSAPHGAKEGDAYLNGRLRLVSQSLIHDHDSVRYRVRLKNVTPHSVEAIVQVRFLDEEGIEYRKGPDREHTKRIRPGRVEEISGTLTMPDPTRISLTFRQK